MSLGKKRNCSKATSYSCGNSCINMSKVCRKEGLQGQSISIAAKLKNTLKASKGSSDGGGETPVKEYSKEWREKVIAEYNAAKKEQEDNKDIGVNEALDNFADRVQGYIKDLSDKGRESAAMLDKMENPDRSLSGEFNAEVGRLLSTEFLMGYGRSNKPSGDLAHNLLTSGDEDLLDRLNDSKENYKDNEEVTNKINKMIGDIEERAIKVKATFANNDIVNFKKLDEIDKDVQRLADKTKNEEVALHLQKSYDNMINGKNNIVNFRSFSEVASLIQAIEQFEVNYLHFAIVLYEAIQLEAMNDELDYVIKNTVG